MKGQKASKEKKKKEERGRRYKEEIKRQIGLRKD